MARQTKQPPKHAPADVRGQPEPVPQVPKRRPDVEELMALSPEEFDAWRRSIGLRTLSELAPDER
jgi:hypothetical protein